MWNKEFFLSNDLSQEKIHCIHNTLWINSDLIVVLSHGFFSDKNSYTNQQLSKTLNEDKIDTFSFDFHGHWNSSGDMGDITISKTIENFETALFYLKESGYKKIWIVSSCLGSIGALKLLNDTAVSTACLKSSFLSHKDFKDFGNVEMVDFWKKQWSIPFNQKERVGEELSHNVDLKYDFYDDLLKNSNDINFDTKKSLYFVHAENDEQFPLERTKQNVSKFQNGKLDVVEWANHYFQLIDWVNSPETIFIVSQKMKLFLIQNLK